MNPIQAITASASGRVACMSLSIQDHQIILNEDRVYRVGSDIPTRYRGVAINCTGTEFACAAGKNSSVEIWNIEATDKFVLENADISAIDLQYSPSESYVLVTGHVTRQLWKVKVWNTELRRCLCEFAPSNFSCTLVSIGIMSLCPCCNHVIVGTPDGCLEIWSGCLPEGDSSSCDVPCPQQNLRVHANVILAISLNRDGSMIASASCDSTIVLVELGSYKDSPCRVAHTLIGHTLAITCVNFSSFGAMVVSGSEDTTIKIWGVATGTCYGTFTGHDDIVTTVHFHVDDQYILSTAWDKSIRLWGLERAAEHVHSGREDPAAHKESFAFPALEGA
jgi:WD40 repeat protein